MVRDQAIEIVERARALRSPTKPIAAKPMRNIAHVDGSGTPEMSIVSFAAPPSAAPEAQLFSEPFLVFRAGPPPPKPNVNTAESMNSGGSKKGAARWANTRLRASRVADRAQERGPGR